MTTTKAKRRTKPAKQPAAAGSEAPSLNSQLSTLNSAEPDAGQVQDIALGLIDEAADKNPRKCFEQGALDELAESIQVHGQLQEVLVRLKPDGNGYELIAGARRLRACRLAGRATVRCRVLDVSEQVATEIRGIENFRRQDFNAVEEAAWFRQMLDGCGYTQATLGERLDLSQGQVANRLRLLELPAEWRDRIISQEISPTHARALCPWSGRPGVLKLVADGLRRDKGPGTVGQWEDTIARAVRRLTQPLREEYYDKHWNRHEVELRPTPEQLAALDVIEFKSDNRVERRAFNVTLCEQLIDEAQRKRAERDGKKTEKASTAAAKLPPAEQKKKRAQQAAQFQKKLYRWKVAWLQSLVLRKLGAIDDARLLKCLLFFAVRESRGGDRGRELAEAVAAAGGRKAADTRRGYNIRSDALGTLASVKADRFRGLALDALRRWLGHGFEGCHTDLFPEDIERLAAEWEIDVRREWKLTEDFLQLHTVEQLKALAREWGTEIKADSRKSLLGLLLALRSVPCPKELLNVKPVSLAGAERKGF